MQRESSLLTILIELTLNCIYYWSKSWTKLMFYVLSSVNRTTLQMVRAVTMTALWSRVAYDALVLHECKICVLFPSYTFFFLV